MMSLLHAPGLGESNATSSRAQAEHAAAGSLPTATSPLFSAGSSHRRSHLGVAVGQQESIGVEIPSVVD